jgi:hypothetical protein
LTAPLAARALGTDGAGRRAARAGEIETIRASATRVLTAARSDAEREAAREVLALADRASLALTPAEAAALDGELARAARGLGAAGDAGAGDGPSPLARGDGAPPADAGGGGERAAGGERSEGPPGASGGAPRDAGAPGAVTLPGPSDPARSSAVALAPAWPSRFDAVVRLYFEGAASRRQPELPATNPQVKR